MKKASPDRFCRCTVCIYSVSGRLGKGVDLPRLKQAELVNTTLEVERVSLIICTVMLTSDL